MLYGQCEVIVKRKKEEKMLGNCIFVGIGGMAGAVILAGSWIR
ncbi:MAG: hypothetical protein ACLU8B_07050 [Lachnospiraceae bacterium]